MTSQLEQAVQLSIEAQKKLGKLHQKIGDFTKQNGAVIQAYQRARRSLEADPTNIELVNRVFSELEEDVGVLMAGLLLESEEIGIEQAEQTFALYGYDFTEPESDSALITKAIEAVESMIRRQRATYIALLLSGEVSRLLLLGDNAVWGILNPRPIITTIKNFVGSILNSVLSRVVTSEPGMGYQAVAILDKKTSPCCRAVDGQVQPIGEPFHLTEPPHYAEFMIQPPFHDGCRTTRALVDLREAQQI